MRWSSLTFLRLQVGRKQPSLPSCFHCVRVLRRSLSSHGDGEQRRHNWIGPPDPVSNIRPMRFKIPATRAEEELQRVQFQVWALNHGFWKKHNTEFQESKAQFVEDVLKHESGGEKGNRRRLTANELSEFYKQFLDDNYEAHMTYTRQWLQMNCILTWLTLKARVWNMFSFRRT